MRTRDKNKLRNDRLIVARKEMGLEHGRDAAKAMKISYTRLVSYENLSESPVSKGGKDFWKSSARQVADWYGLSPAYLWPEHAALMPTHIEFSTDPLPQPYDSVVAREMKERVKAAIATLAPREECIIRDMFGILTDEGEKTLTDVGILHKVSRSRIQQILTKSLLKLRHSSRSKDLICVHPDYDVLVDKAKAWLLGQAERDRARKEDWERHQAWLQAQEEEREKREELRAKKRAAENRKQLLQLFCIFVEAEILSVQYEKSGYTKYGARWWSLFYTLRNNLTVFHRYYRTWPTQMVGRLLPSLQGVELDVRWSAMDEVDRNTLRSYGLKGLYSREEAVNMHLHLLKIRMQRA